MQSCIERNQINASPYMSLSYHKIAPIYINNHIKRMKTWKYFINSLSLILYLCLFLNNSYKIFLIPYLDPLSLPVKVDQAEI